MAAGSDLSADGSLTHAAAEFAARVAFDDLPAEAVRIARRCVLDGLAVALAGTEQPAIAALGRYVRKVGGAPDSRVIGDAGLRVPAHLAALWNGTAGHAMDWDDTQLSEGPGRLYGLLTHPTMAPLSASLAVADMLGGVDGRTFLTAFVAGFEVECKVAEAINPEHYVKGFHTSGTIGTFAAAVAAAKLLGLDAGGIAQSIGIAASMASGIRAGFGTMTKPLHMGRAAENGVTAALLVSNGFTGTTEGLDGEWGYLAVAGRGGEPELVIDRFGDPFSIADPGVSIKPYPCGVLTHPSMDAMLAVMREESLAPVDIASVTLRAGNNIVKPIRFAFPTNELEAKFCMPFLLSAIIVAGKAGKAEFTDEFVTAPAVEAMQRKVTIVFDPEIDARGYERIRSRLEVETTDGRAIVRDADENYRGGPQNPITDDELAVKFADCAEGLLDKPAQAAVLDTVWSLAKAEDATALLPLLDTQRTAGA